MSRTSTSSLWCNSEGGLKAVFDSLYRLVDGLLDCSGHRPGPTYVFMASRRIFWIGRSVFRNWYLPDRSATLTTTVCQDSWELLGLDARVVFFSVCQWFLSEEIMWPLLIIVLCENNDEVCWVASNSFTSHGSVYNVNLMKKKTVSKLTK